MVLDVCFCVYSYRAGCRNAIDRHFGSIEQGQGLRSAVEQAQSSQ